MADAFVSLFERARLGDRVARDAVYKLAFCRLKVIASALVSELFLKFQRLEARIVSEDHFFRLSARAMRQVLIDHAQGKRAIKVPLELIPELLLPAHQNTASPESLLAVKMVFEKLRTM